MKKQISNLFRFLIFLGIGAGILALVYWHQNKAYRDECCLKRNPSWTSIASVEEKEALLAACRATIDKSAECIPLTDKQAIRQAIADEIFACAQADSTNSV